LEAAIGIKRYATRLLLTCSRNKAGAVSVEYALLITFIALIMVLGAVILGGGLRTVLTDIGDTVANAPTCSPRRMAAAAKLLVATERLNASGGAQ